MENKHTDQLQGDTGAARPRGWQFDYRRAMIHTAWIIPGM